MKSDNLQEGFAPFAPLLGYSTGVVRRVESLPIPVRWGRMVEATRQVEGLFESLLAESFGEIV